MKNLIEAAEAALQILDRTHALNGGPCLGPEHCPMAETIRYLTLAIAEAKIPTADMPTKFIEYPMGCTVAELKAVLANWPDNDATGEPNGVWMETGSATSSSPCMAIWPLNMRNLPDGRHTGDILFAPTENAWSEGKTLRGIAGLKFPDSEPEATYPAHTVKDIDPSPSRPSFMPAQRLCVICDAILPPDADIHTNTCPNCGTAGGI